MTHRMKLVDFAFNAIKSGRKDIEVRLNDEKRRLLKIGDSIEFINMETGELLKVKIINLYKFDSFSSLFNYFDYKRLGLSSGDSSIMYDFYSKEEEDKYGALGIEIKKI